MEIKTGCLGRFAEADLKTSDFRWIRNTKTLDGKGNGRKIRRVSISRVLKLRFPADNARLGAFVAAGRVFVRSRSPSPIPWRTREAKEWLLREGQRLHEKALVLAAACVNLRVREIDYSWGERICPPVPCA
ncbi:MAG: hypothetical protein ACLRSW_12200 [Christensenellaceae bacterium]